MITNHDTKEEILKMALNYQSKGFSIIPLKEAEKTPRESWSKWQNERANEKQIRKWFEQYPNMNIGIVTGKISNIVVIDIEKDGNNSGYPQTATAKSGGGGIHLVYKYPEGVDSIKNAIRFRDLTDLKADNGYIVAPPSIHPSGEKYEWLIEIEKTSNLAEFPLEILKETKCNNKKIDSKTITEEKVFEGSRNTSATQLVGKLLRETPVELWDISVWGGLKEWNNKVCEPPLSESELKNIFESIKKSDLEKRYPEDDLKQLILKEDKKKSYFLIARSLEEKYHIKTIGTNREKKLYIYKDGIYKEGIDFIKSEIQNTLEENASSFIKKEITEILKDLTYIEEEDIGIEPNFLNLNNGILNLENMELLPHDHNKVFFTKIPVNYNPEAKCPLICNFLEEILDPEVITIIQEWTGFILYRKYFIKKAIIFVGEKDTGKTTLLNIITKLIGEENISGVNLQRISSDKFAIAHLKNKYLNVFDDLSIKDISDNGAFKMVTGGGLVTGEFKFGGQFQFKNYAKLTFSCNKIPSVKETNDDAYFSRWIIIPFNYATDKPDKFLLDRILTQEEMSGLFNFALKGLDRILKQQSFSYKKEPEEIKEEMLKSGSPVANFVFDRLEKGAGDDWISKEDLYKEFSKYVNEKDLPTQLMTTFGKNINRYCDFVSDGKKGVVTGWRGIKIKNNKKEEEGALENEDLFRNDSNKVA